MRPKLTFRSFYFSLTIYNRKERTIIVLPNLKQNSQNRGVNMSNTDSTMEIKSSKVEFSAEVLNYFENLKTEENSKWIDKYFEVLSDTSNLNSEKYHIHHIRPCNTFKDESHKK